MDRQYLTTGDLAKFLKRSRSWVQLQITREKIKVISGHTLGDRVHYRISIEEALRLWKEREPYIRRKCDMEILAGLLRISVRQVRKYYDRPTDKKYK